MLLVNEPAVPEGVAVLLDGGYGTEDDSGEAEDGELTMLADSVEFSGTEVVESGAVDVLVIDSGTGEPGTPVDIGTPLPEGGLGRTVSFDRG